MTEAHFENIKEVLCAKLTQASKSITIAIAWLNDPVLFNIILKKAAEISVELLLVNDRINNTCGNDFNSFIQTANSKLFFSDSSKLMHHKFVIIDYQYVITGSYNWTRGARNKAYNLLYCLIQSINFYLSPKEKKRGRFE